VIEAVDLGTENDERMARLREALALGGGFQLVIVQVEPGEQREEVLRRLAGWSGCNGVPRLELMRLAAGESPMMRLAGGHAGVILVGLEAEGHDRAERMRQMVTELNWSRDRLPDLVRGPLILVVSQRVQTELFEQAPDFYSWRTHSTHIDRPAQDRVAPLVWLGTRPEDPADLEAMIAAAHTLRPPPLHEIAKLHARLAHVRQVAGRSDAAEYDGRLAVAHAEASGSPDVIAHTRAELGRIACQNNHLELAEEVLRRDITEASVQARAELAEARAQLALRRGDELEARTELRAALAGFEARGRAEDAARVRRLLAQLDAMRS
jgi:hypothetical protein